MRLEIAGGYGFMNRAGDTVRCNTRWCLGKDKNEANLTEDKEYEIIQEYVDEDERGNILGMSSYYEIEDDNGDIIIVDSGSFS